MQPFGARSTMETLGIPSWLSCAPATATQAAARQAFRRVGTRHELSLPGGGSFSRAGSRWTTHINCCCISQMTKRRWRERIWQAGNFTAGRRRTIKVMPTRIEIKHLPDEEHAIAIRTLFCRECGKTTGEKNPLIDELLNKISQAAFDEGRLFERKHGPL